MIAYFDTSAIIPLIVSEEGSPRAETLWMTADHVVTVRLTTVEAHAALGQAHRLGRMDDHAYRAAADGLARLLDKLHLVEVDAQLLDLAARLAPEHALRAYDAVHLASAARFQDRELVLVAGDEALLEAAATTGIATADILRPVVET